MDSIYDKDSSIPGSDFGGIIEMDMGISEWICTDTLLSDCRHLSSDCDRGICIWLRGWNSNHPIIGYRIYIFYDSCDSHNAPGSADDGSGSTHRFYIQLI